MHLADLPRALACVPEQTSTCATVMGSEFAVYAVSFRAYSAHARHRAAERPSPTTIADDADGVRPGFTTVRLLAPNLTVLQLIRPSRQAAVN